MVSNLAQKAKNNRAISSLLSGLEFVKGKYFFSKQICFEETKIVQETF